MKPKKLGRYDIIAELGRGAMGTVYKGLDPKIERTVALKVLNFRRLKEGSDSMQARERFMVEARATGQLSHPNILTIYDVGEEGDNAYIAMEFLDGGTLEDMMEEGKLKDYEQIFDIIGQIALGLSHAHSRNVVHRDVKPANIMMADGNTPKITDFGLARFTDSNLTTTGTVLGTPNYMSPEQVRGRKIDGRSDLFALGIMLYEMLTGEKPFAGDSITSVIYRVVNEDPIPPKHLNMDLPDYIDAFFAKALAKNPDKRFQTGEKFKDGLQGTISGAYSAEALTAKADAGQTLVITPSAKAAAGARFAAAGTLDIISSKVTKTVAAGIEAIKKRTGLSAYAIVGAAFFVGLFFFSIIFSVTRGEKHELKRQASKPPAAEEPAVPPPEEGKALKGIDTVKVQAPEKAAVKEPPKTEGVKPAEAEKKAEVKSALLSIKSRPTGANVYVDGKLVGKTPYLKGSYELKKFKIRVTKKGYKDDVFTINLIKDRELIVKLQKPMPVVKSALLTIKSEPAGAAVYVDGKLVGETPYIKGKHKLKELKVKVSKEGYKDDVFTVNLKKNRELIVELEELEVVAEEEAVEEFVEETEVGFFTKMFKPEKAGNVGTLIVIAKPGDKVTVDGRKYDEFPIKLQYIPIGRHNIYIVRKGKKPFLKTVILRRGETLTVEPKF